MIESTLTELLSQEYPEQRELCGKWLRTGELVMCYAPRGTGKSLWAASLAYAVASGLPFLGSNPACPARVLYIESEMPDRLTAKRFSSLEYRAAAAPLPETLHILRRGPDGNLPNLSLPDGQAFYAERAKFFDLIVIDNLTTIAPPLDNRDDDTKAWYRIKPFIYSLRNSDKCVLIIHHAGKSGAQLGTSLRENDMDVILRLTTPDYDSETNRLRFYLDFDKARDLEPNDRAGWYMEYENIAGSPMWTYKPAKEFRANEIRRLATKISNKLILAQMLGCPTWLVHQVLAEKVKELEDPDYFNGDWNDDKEPLF